MTTIKRIVAVFLAVMMLAAVCATAASAADVNTLKITITKDGFEYDVYKIAELDKTDGSYTFPTGVDESVQNVVKTIQKAEGTKTPGKVFRDQLDALYDNGAGFGTRAAIVKKGAPFTATEEGIYYAVVTKVPSTYKEANNVVVVWPEYNKTSKSWDYHTYDNDTVDIGAKVNDGTDFFDKYFSEDFGKAEKAKYQFSGQSVGEEVNFTLEADIVGTSANNLNSFVFKDDMSAGLDYVAGSMHVYYGTADAITTTTNIDSLFDGLEAQTKDDNGTHFTISAKAATLSSADFYDHKKVYVQYTAKINNKAVVGVEGNPNTGKLVYKNAAGVEKTLGPVDRIVWTFNVEATKYNGSTNQPLKGAKFGLYTDHACSDSKKVAEGTSDASGKVQFKATDNTGNSNPYCFAPGTYYVKEIEAPSGFAISTVTHTVTISDNLNAYSDAKSIVKVNNDEPILNYPVKLPETGGAGTLMFTIIGGILVLAAGAMFIIIMKKRSSSK